MPITQKLQLGPIKRFLSNRKVSLQSKSFGWEKSLSGEKSFGGEKSMGRNQWGEIYGEKSMGRNQWGEINGEKSMGRNQWGEICIDGLSASKIKLFLTISPYD